MHPPPLLQPSPCLAQGVQCHCAHMHSVLLPPSSHLVRGGAPQLHSHYPAATSSLLPSSARWKQRSCVYIHPLCLPPSPFPVRDGGAETVRASPPLPLPPSPLPVEGSMTASVSTQHASIPHPSHQKAERCTCTPSIRWKCHLLHLPPSPCPQTGRCGMGEGASACHSCLPPLA